MFQPKAHDLAAKKAAHSPVEFLLHSTSAIPTLKVGIATLKSVRRIFQSRTVKFQCSDFYFLIYFGTGL